MYSKKQLLQILETIKSAKLNAPNAFVSAPIADLQKICNGIGADWQSEASRRKLTRMMSYAEASAAIHDWQYYMSNGSESWRAAVDEEFLVNALREIRFKFKWYNPRRWLAERAVLVGYCVLQRVGRAAWAIAHCERCKKSKKAK